MLQNVQVSDTTGDAITTNAGNMIILFYKIIHRALSSKTNCLYQLL